MFPTAWCRPMQLIVIIAVVATSSIHHCPSSTQHQSPCIRIVIATIVIVVARREASTGTSHETRATRHQARQARDTSHEARGKASAGTRHAARGTRSLVSPWPAGGVNLRCPTFISCALPGILQHFKILPILRAHYFASAHPPLLLRVFLTTCILCIRDDFVFSQV